MSGNEGWDIAKDTGIGALTGLAGGSIGKYASQMGGVLINNLKVTSPLLQGMIGGSLGGGITNTSLTFGMALINGASFDEALAAGSSSFLSGAALGVVIGGASASARSLANNINPINGRNMDPLANARRLGLEGENAVGINNADKVRIEVNGRTRIPDRLTNSVLEEVKNVKHLNFTKQLRDFYDHTSMNNLDMILHTRNNTTFSGPLQRMIDNGSIIDKIIPGL